MIDLGIAAAAYCGFAMVAHLVTTGLAVRRCRARDADAPVRTGLPPVSIIRPVCGLDEYDPLTLESTFLLDYDEYEIIFCAARESDPAVALVLALLARYPTAPARLLIGDELATPNPKLNNMAKGWDAARHEWVVFADSNVLMPRDYLQRLLLSWRLDTGLVCSPPIGDSPDGFWAKVECAFLNTYQARWQYAADSIGYGFAQGKTMLWRRSELEACGGMAALAREIAEDAASTKVVREAGHRVRLVDRPFGQPLGRRSLAAVWSRQLRWAQLRRQSFPLQFLPEILTGSLPPAIAAEIAAASAFDATPLLASGLVLAFWFACETWLARSSRWHLDWVSPLAWLVRDLIQPLIWGAAWLKQQYAWRGNTVQIVDASRTVEVR